jgi:methylmalonyl-CoA mutase
MAAAIEKGIPKMRIEEAAARTQARIDSGEQVLVGVNACYRPEQDIEVDVLKVDNAEVRARQLAKLQQLKGTRDVGAGRERARRAHRRGARRRQSARIRHPRRARQGDRRRDLARAGKGLRPPRRHRADHFRRLPQGARRKPPTVDRVQDKVEAFEKKTGSKPRILVAKMGQDGHDRGQKVIATAFADLGFDVTVGAMFQTPEEIAKLAIEHDVHIVGASSLAAGHLTLIPELKQALSKARPRRHPDRRRRRHPADDFDAVRARPARRPSSRPARSSRMPRKR